MHLHVLTSAKSPGISGGLTYESDTDVQPGLIVRVPLRNSSVEGIVLGKQEADQKFDVKSIKNVLSEFPLLSNAQLSTAQWMAEYYMCSIRHALSPFLPGKPWSSLLPEDIVGYRLQHSTSCRGTKQQMIVDALSSKQWMSWDELREQTGASIATIRSLLETGIIEKEVRSEFSSSETLPASIKRPSLSVEQQRAYEKIVASTKPSLLFGVTGSGKTEVYMQLIADAVSQGKQIIVLVPEILLTQHSLPRYAECINAEHIAVLHSRLTPAQKRDTWKKIRYGDIKLILGSRSALFAPVQDLGLVIIDEEHEWTYKNEQTPRYHAREVAHELCKQSNARLVLGSATPSIESWQRAKNDTYTLAELPNRFGNAQMPHVKVIDLGNVAFGNNYPFSNTLFQAIEDRLHKQEQSVLFLNRRGMATSLLCMECRRRIVSPESNLPFTVHRHPDNQYYLQDHISGATARIPDECPACKSTKLQTVGSGTQGVEDSIKRKFPNARVLRADADTLTSPEEMRTILNAMSNREADILLGTQSVVKGLDLPSVTLAAVLIADVGMSLPHFRAGERVFQLLTQLTGRSGRKVPGEVIIQTFRPDSLEVKLSALHKTRDYLDQELSIREAAAYPPALPLVRIVLRGDSQKIRASTIAEEISKNFPTLRVSAAPTFFGGGAKWHVFLRGEHARDAASSIKDSDITIDVDPLDCV